MMKGPALTSSKPVLIAGAVLFVLLAIMVGYRAYEKFYISESYENYADVPPISADEKGPRIVLVPLQDGDMWLINYVRNKLEDITGIKTSIRRVEGFEWERPDRVFGEKQVVEGINVLTGKTYQFAPAHKEGYISVLSNYTKYEQDPQRKQVGKRLLEYVKMAPEQYNANKYNQLLRSTISSVFPGDEKTVFVAITNRDLFLRDGNYVFSAWLDSTSTNMAIISYARLYDPEAIEPEQLLAERLTKELIPISLKSLKIRESEEQGDPVRYARNVTEVDQKNLELPAEVKTQIEELKSN